MHQCARIRQRLKSHHVQLFGDLGPGLPRQVLPAVSGDQSARQRLPDLHAGLRPRAAAKFHQAPDQGHLRFKIVVDQGVIDRGPRRQMHAVQVFGCREQVLPQPLGHKGHERGHDQHQVPQTHVQRLQRGLVTGPEPTPRTTDVPVRHVIDQLGDQPTGGLGVKGLKGRVDIADRGVGARQQPTIHLGELGTTGAWLPIGQPAIQRLEGGRAPQG